MSLSVLERTDSKKTLYLSTDGAGQIPVEYLKEIKDVAIALDNDAAGREMAQRIKRMLPNALVKTPKTVDWNQDLVNTFDWSDSSKAKIIKHQPQHKTDIDRGWSR